MTVYQIPGCESRPRRKAKGATMSKSAGRSLRPDISLRNADGDARQNRRQPGSTPGTVLHQDAQQGRVRR